MSDTEDLLAMLDSDDESGNEQINESEETKSKFSSYDLNTLNPSKDNSTAQNTDTNSKEDSIKSIFKISKLTANDNYKEILKKVDDFNGEPKEKNLQLTSTIEQDPEYQLIISANNLTVEIDNEIVIIHKYLRDHYVTRFPELEQLVPNPLDYARTVKAIGKEMDLSKVDLKPILPSGTIMIVNIQGAATVGKPLSETQLSHVLEAAQLALDFDDDRTKILNYVESRMTFIAPNLSAIVGTRTAARLMGVAGGIAALSRIPSCNIITLGANRLVATGLSRISNKAHEGLIFSAPIIQSSPPDLRKKFARILSNKCALACRMDLSRDYPDGSYGRKFREDADKQMERLIEPPPSKNVKALPVPDDGPKKRRAGRRVRKAKEAYAITDLQKARNRMAFGEAEEEAMGIDSSEGLGMVGTSSGKIRAAAVDTRIKGTLNKRHKAIINATANASGFTTSLSFTPAQGIELENPDLRQPKGEAGKDKYFKNFKKFLYVDKNNKN